MTSIVRFDGIEDAMRLVPAYEKMLLDVLDAILDRYERDPEYPFIDTKINIITGEDFDPPSPENIYKGKDVIYSWIQGRALEALTGHAIWLKNCSLLSPSQADEKISKIKKILGDVINSMENIRLKNSGRMFFTFSRQGKPLESNMGRLRRLARIPDESNYSDLFYSKGLFCAASYLALKTKAEEAEQYFNRVVNDIQNRGFMSDQQSFDPKNQVSHIAGRHPLGPFMIALSGFSETFRITAKAEHLMRARKFMEYVFKKHINMGDRNAMQMYDFWESVDDSGNPWQDCEAILCDPGHALEFIGLSLNCLLQMRDNEEFSSFLAKCRSFYPGLMEHCFELGFNPEAGGICKTYDLKSRKPVNTDMPWWSLPETIRAASEMIDFVPKSSYTMLKIIQISSNAFLKTFINPKVHSMAYQTCNAKGTPIDIIPAMPDIDPGYHTGLSIIKFLDIIRNLSDKFETSTIEGGLISRSV